MADGEGEGDQRESQATKQNGLSPSKHDHTIPSPNPSESSVSMGLSGQENGMSYGGSVSDDNVDPLQEAPLDFSVKRIGTSSIPIQNLNNKLANGLHRGIYEHKARHNREQTVRSASKSESQSRYVDDGIPAIKTEAVSPPPHVNGSSPSSNGTRCTSIESPENRIGEPQIALPGTLPTSMLQGGAAGLLPILPPGIMSTSGMLNGLSLTPDLIDGKHAQNGKSRHLKANAKDQLVFPPPFGALPALPQIPGLDMITAHAMAANSEEVFAQYKQYVMALQEQFRSQTSPGGSSTSSSQGQRYSGMHSPPGSGQEYTPLPPSASASQFNIPTSPENSTRSPHLYRQTGGSRKRGKSLPDEQKDEAYWERRRKNNEAAKRSRDARRAKEDEIAIRAAFLEQENLKLRVEVAALKTETAKLRCMLYNS